MTIILLTSVSCFSQTVEELQAESDALSRQIDSLDDLRRSIDEKIRSIRASASNSTFIGLISKNTEMLNSYGYNIGARKGEIIQFKGVEGEYFLTKEGFRVPQKDVQLQGTEEENANAVRKARGGSYGTLVSTYSTTGYSSSTYRRGNVYTIVTTYQGRTTVSTYVSNH